MYARVLFWGGPFDTCLHFLEGFFSGRGLATFLTLKDHWMPHPKFRSDCVQISQRLKRILACSTDCIITGKSKMEETLLLHAPLVNICTNQDKMTSRFGEKGPFVPMWIYLLKNYRKAYELHSTSREEIALSSCMLKWAIFIGQRDLYIRQKEPYQSCTLFRYMGFNRRYIGLLLRIYRFIFCGYVGFFCGCLRLVCRYVGLHCPKTRGLNGDMYEDHR